MLSDTKLRDILRKHSNWLAIRPDAQRADLSDEDLSHRWMANVDLTNAIMRSTDCTGSCIMGAKLSGIDARGAIFKSSHVSHSSFRRSILTGAMFDMADCEFSDFQEAIMCDVSAKQADFDYSRMTCADMQRGDFSDAHFNFTDLSHVIMTGAKFFSGIETSYMVFISGIGARVWCMQNHIKINNVVMSRDDILTGRIELLRDSWSDKFKATVDRVLPMVLNIEK